MKVKVKFLSPVNSSGRQFQAGDVGFVSESEVEALIQCGVCEPLSKPERAVQVTVHLADTLFARGAA